MQNPTPLTRRERWARLRRTLCVGLVAVVVGFGAWWTYFDFARAPPSQTRTGGHLQWLLSRLPLTAAIAAGGCRS